MPEDWMQHVHHECLRNPALRAQKPNNDMSKMTREQLGRAIMECRDKHCPTFVEAWILKPIVVAHFNELQSLQRRLDESEASNAVMREASRIVLAPYWEEKNASLIAVKRDRFIALEKALSSESGKSFLEEKDRYKSALENLDNRLLFIHEDPTYQYVWVSFMNHGGDYSNGPKYDKELESAQRVLATPQPTETKEKE